MSTESSYQVAMDAMDRQKRKKSERPNAFLFPIDIWKWKIKIQNLSIPGNQGNQTGDEGTPDGLNCKICTKYENSCSELIESQGDFIWH